MLYIHNTDLAKFHMTSIRIFEQKVVYWIITRGIRLGSTKKRIVIVHISLISVEECKMTIKVLV